MNIEIAEANVADVKDLIEIYSSPHLYHTREDAGWFVKSFFDYHHIKVVKNNGKIIGTLFWNAVEEKHHGVAEIADLWIEENFRRKGLGERLLRTAIEDIKKFYTKDNHLLRKVLVTTGDDNEPAKNLYEKTGFKKIAVLRDLFAKGESELVYVLTYNP